MSRPADQQPMVVTGSYALWAELTWDLCHAGYYRSHQKYLKRKEQIIVAIKSANAAIEKMMVK